MGALFYDDQLIIRPRGPGISEPGKNDDSADETDPDPARIALVYTTVATWQLLNGKETAILAEYPIAPGQATADRATGLRPRPVMQAIIPYSASMAI